MAEELKKGSRVFVSGKTWVVMGTVTGFTEEGEKVPWIKTDDGQEWSAYDVSIRTPRFEDADLSSREIGKKYVELLKAVNEDFPYIAENKKLRAENERFKVAGICELAASNPNLKSYMEEWEARAERAEADSARRMKARDHAAQMGLDFKAERDELKAETRKRILLAKAEAMEEAAGIARRISREHKENGRFVEEWFSLRIAVRQSNRAAEYRKEADHAN